MRRTLFAPVAGSNSFDHQRFVTTGSPITTCRPNEFGPTGLSTSCGFVTGHAQNTFLTPRFIPATPSVGSNSFDHQRFVTTGSSITTCRPNEFGPTRALSYPCVFSLTGRTKKILRHMRRTLFSPAVGSNSFDHQRFIATCSSRTTCWPNKFGPTRALSHPCVFSLTGRTKKILRHMRRTLFAPAVGSNSFDHQRFVTTGSSITTCRPNEFGPTGLRASFTTDAATR